MLPDAHPVEDVSTLLEILLGRQVGMASSRYNDMFQPFLRFYGRSLRRYWGGGRVRVSTLLEILPDTAHVATRPLRGCLFQPFLRFYVDYVRFESNYVHDMRFQPFLRFYRLGMLVCGLWGVSTLLEILLVIFTAVVFFALSK